MNQHEWLAGRIEEERPHLRAVAYRMLGSLSEADDAVQEAWLRLSRADTTEVENMRAWLTVGTRATRKPGRYSALSRRSRYSWIGTVALSCGRCGFSGTKPRVPRIMP